ncbi:hypothetical protein SRRS_24370 [Sporomusa rhizae]
MNNLTCLLGGFIFIQVDKKILSIIKKFALSQRVERNLLL